MDIFIVLIIVILLFGGLGGSYYARNYYGGVGFGGVFGLVLIVCIVLWLVRGG